MIDIIFMTEKFIDPLYDWVCLWLACPRRSDSGKWREMGVEEMKNVRESEEEKERTRAFSPQPPRCAVTTIWTPAKRQQQLSKFVSSSFLSLFFRLFLLPLFFTVPRNLFALKYSCYTLKTLGHVHWLNRMIFVQHKKRSGRIMNSNGTELDQVVHTHRTLFWGGWPRGFGSLNPHAHS